MLQDDQFYMMSDCYLGLTDLDADKPILSSFGLEPKMETRNPSEPTGEGSCQWLGPNINCSSAHTTGQLKGTILVLMWRNGSGVQDIQMALGCALSWSWLWPTDRIIWKGSSTLTRELWNWNTSTWYPPGNWLWQEQFMIFSFLLLDSLYGIKWRLHKIKTKSNKHVLVGVSLSDVATLNIF